MPFIVLIGIILRLIYIDKPEGLWNDEYVSWMVAATPFNDGFWQAVIKQCHMPLYYLYLKPFAQCSDIILRLTSVIPGIIAIPVMYLVGKEYSKKTGYFAAVITSVLSFAIYYSQEVRFYSLLFLLSALLLLFTIRVNKNPSKKNFLLFNIFSILIIFTHVLGCIFVFFNYIYFFYKQKRINNLSKIKIIGYSVAFSIIGLILLFSGSNILSQLPNSQWWSSFSYTNILFLFSDFFSPILTNNISSASVFLYSSKIALWLIIPTIIGVICMISGIKQNKGIAVVSLLTIVSLSILAKTGIIVFITKYSIEVLPVFIILLACGAVRLKNTGYILFLFFISIHLLALFSPYHVTKIFRGEGNRIVGEILNQRKPQNVIFTYYAPDRFKRYTDLDKFRAYDISKSYRFKYVDNPAVIFEEIPNNETVSLVILNTVSFYTDEQLKDNTAHIPEMYKTFSHIKNELYKNIKSKNYPVLFIDNYGAWTVITINNTN